jgi:predicted AAA+ superfamily ATPase
MDILPRAVAPLLAQALRTLRVVVVTGPRQAGKSTFVEHHADLAGLPYLSLDAPQTLRNCAPGRIRTADPLVEARSTVRF